MVNKKIVIVVYVLVMLAVLPYIQAKISLGSVQDGKSAEIAQGDTAVFRILFFNVSFFWSGYIHNHPMTTEKMWVIIG